MCKSGETKPGKSTVKLTIGDSAIVFKNVPSEICHDCSEEYISDENTKTILATSKESAKKGIASEIIDWDRIKELL